jgi:hypothetical protein
VGNQPGLPGRQPQQRQDQEQATSGEDGDIQLNVRPGSKCRTGPTGASATGPRHR